ncbi:Rab-GAP TBC domain-containing protein, variant 2 [Balamuthia mandrillaris]
MAVNEEEFVELLEGESAIDLNNLREVSMFGVPDSVRGEVWKYLLGVSKEDKSQEMKMVRKLKEEYDQLDKTIHSEDIRNISRELKRFRPNITELHTDTNRKRFVYLITAYVNSHTEFEYISNGTLSLLAPFVYLCEEEYAAFFCFDSLVKRMEGLFCFVLFCFGILFLSSVSFFFFFSRLSCKPYQRKSFLRMTCPKTFPC